MKVNMCLPFLLGVVYSVVAILLGDWNANDSAQQVDEAKEFPVLVATQLIKPFVPLGDQMVNVRSMPVSQVPSGAIRTVKDYERRALRELALPGQVITRSMLTEKGDFQTCEPLPAYRVYSLFLDDGTLAQLDLSRLPEVVEAFVTYTSRDAEGDETVKTKQILKEAEVFSIRLQDYPDGKGLIHLLVTPEEAAILMMAQRKGSITCRFPADDGE